MRALRRVRATLTAMILLPLLASPCSSQISIDAGFRNDRFSGSIAEVVVSTGERVRLRPFDADLPELAVHGQLGRVRLGLSYARASSRISADDGSTQVQLSSGERLDEFALLAGLEVVSGVHLLLGPQVGRWSVLAEPTRYVLGGHAGLEISRRVEGPLHIFARAGMARVGRVLRPDALDADQLVGSLTRRSLVVGGRAVL